MVPYRREISLKKSTAVESKKVSTREYVVQHTDGVLLVLTGMHTHTIDKGKCLTADS
jgi:hypothetical protein